MNQYHNNNCNLLPLHVELGAQSYEIHIGAGVVSRAGELISSATRSRRAFIITHPVIDRLHGETLRRALPEFAVDILLFPPGERQKSLRRANVLYGELLARGADRSALLLAFGGGVVGDLAGFVAATYMRGIPYIQIPTTLLAQVDSAVGGKVAVDHPKAKNLIGAFYQPRLVLSDPQVLLTLPAREYRSGLAEVVKHAVIADAHLFAWLEQNIGPVSKCKADAVSYIVRRSCEIKSEVVRQDEKESGLRAILNFGHTVGHALESLTDYRALRHGEAVAIGMAAAARLAQLLGLFSEESVERIEKLLIAFKLPVRIKQISATAIMNSIRSDKKAVGGVARFVLPREIGSVDIHPDVPPETIKRALISVGASE